MLNFIYFEVAVIFLYHLSSVSTISMEEISIMGGKDYLQLRRDDKAVLECKYVLEEGETVKKVTWHHNGNVAFSWGPTDPAKIGEDLKEGDVVLTRGDGNLEFTSLRLELEGDYVCEVMTSTEKTATSSSYQLLVVDIPDVPDMVTYKVEDCKIKFSWDGPAVTPKPDVVCGVWSTAHGYIQMATKWMATPYYNGSVSYSLDDETFEIFHMPIDAIIRCEIKIKKGDHSEVLLMEKSYNFTEVWERGCPPLEVGDGVHLDYDNERLTCHAEVRSKDESAPVIAHVKCKDGYTPKYKDYVTSVDLICKDTRWDIGGGLTWNHFDNLLCVVQPDIPKPPPQKETASSQESSQESPQESPSENIKDASSSVNSLITPWALIFLLGLTLFSGLIWGLKSHPKKKDPRFMA